MSFINNVAIIPARGGSKRIKKKNIKLFNNVNILSLTVSLIKKEKFFKKIYISTDDDKIKRIAKKLDLEIIHREKRLSGDFTSTIDVIKNSIKIINIKDKLNYICCIYPCNPFLNMSDVRKCYKIVKKNQNFVFPVVKYSHPIQRAFTLSKSGKIKPANKNILIILDRNSFKCSIYDISFGSLIFILLKFFHFKFVINILFEIFSTDVSFYRGSKFK